MTFKWQQSLIDNNKKRVIDKGLFKYLARFKIN